MKKKNSQPELNFFNRLTKPVLQKVINESTVIFDKHYEITFQSDLMETLYLNSKEDLNKETGFLTDNDIKDLIINYKPNTVIGPKINLELNNIQTDLETSEIFQMQLNLISEPSESLLYAKRNNIRNHIIEKKEEECIDDSSSLDFLKEIESNESSVNNRYQSGKYLKNILNENVQNVNYQGNKVKIDKKDTKNTKIACNCECIIF